MVQSTEAFAGQVVANVAAVSSGVMTNLGHKLGLYRAMAKQPSGGGLYSLQLGNTALPTPRCLSPRPGR
ncbi:MAG: hypothetical protein ACI9ON_000468 [Limisphaerales bacterium]|jgi:hypothetical protein